MTGRSLWWSRWVKGLRSSQTVVPHDVIERSERELDALLKKHDVAPDPGLWPAYQKLRLAAARARRRTFAGAAAVVALVGLVAHAGRA